jgi:hypothetical protein
MEYDRLVERWIRIVLQCMCECWESWDHVIFPPPRNRFFINLERMVKCQCVSYSAKGASYHLVTCHIILNNANISEFEPVVDVNKQKISTFLLTLQQSDLVFVLFSSSPSYRLILVLSSVNFSRKTLNVSEV